MGVLVIHICLLIGSIYAIVKVSDVFVDIASGLGKRAGLSDYFIGSFLVGIGTSLPELFTSIAAVTSGSPELVIPTVFGTIAANIGGGLGLGVLCLFFFVHSNGQRRFFSLSNPKSDGYIDFSRTRRFPIIVAASSVLLALILCLYDNIFYRPEATVFTIFYVAFIGWQIHKSRHHQQSDDDDLPQKKSFTESEKTPLQIGAIFQIVLPFLIIGTFLLSLIYDEVRTFALAQGTVYWIFIVGLIALFGYICWDYLPQLRRQDNSPQRTDLTTKPLPLQLIVFVTSIVFLYVTGEIIVGSLGNLADQFQIKSGVLAASALAIGTSLPDIVVAIIVLRRGRDQLLVGHIFQSNIFDAFLILGVCGLIQPLDATVPALISIVASVALTLPLLLALRFRKINLTGGLGLFVGFIVFLFFLYG